MNQLYDLVDRPYHEPKCQQQDRHSGVRQRMSTESRVARDPYAVPADLPADRALLTRRSPQSEGGEDVRQLTWLGDEGGSQEEFLISAGAEVLAVRAHFFVEITSHVGSGVGDECQPCTEGASREGD